MSLRHHRIAAVSILVVGVTGLFGWGRSMALESPEVRLVRQKLQGEWVAELVQAGKNRKLEGASAEKCRVVFDGKSVVFQELIDADSARGTYYLDRHDGVDWVDFKLDAGWIIGIYEVSGDRLVLCINALAPPERLGVPTRRRPLRIQPGEDRHYYVFRRESPGL